MAKLAILFLAVVAFQAASAGVPRFFGGETMMMTTKFDTMGHWGMHTVGDYTMQMHMWFKKLMDCCEHTMMTKDMMMTCIRKLMTVCDYCIEKLCMEGKCDSTMMHEICMEFKNIKMMLERCLTCDFHEMKMECMECCKMFFRCCEKMMMCDNCCVGFDAICKDICMCWVDFCKSVCGGMGMHAVGDYTMEMHMWFKKMMACCEHSMMTKDMMMTCIRKFMTVCDYCIEKLCMEGKCHNVMMHEICMEFRNIKMMLERCLTCDFHEMKMEWMECCKMFFRCCEKMMMCDNCCVGFDVICKEICMCWVDFCKTVCNRMYTTKTYGMDTYMYKTMNMMPYFFHRLR